MFKINADDNTNAPPLIELTPGATIHSEALQALSSLAAKTFQENGVLVINNLLSKSKIKELCNFFFQRYSAYLTEQAVTNSLHVGHKRKMITVNIEDNFNDPDLYANPLLMPILEAQLGSDFLLGSFGVVCSLPGAQDQHVHIDHYSLFSEQKKHLALPSYAINLIIPLVDLTRETGSTRVWKGSHTHALEQDIPIEHSDLILAPRGSCYLMDYQLTHCGTANHSESPRPILYITYYRSWFIESVNYEFQPPITINPSEYQKVPTNYKFLFEREKTFQQIKFDAIENYIQQNYILSIRTRNSTGQTSKPAPSVLSLPVAQSIALNHSIIAQILPKVEQLTASTRAYQVRTGVDTTNSPHLNRLIEPDGAAYLYYQPQGKSEVFLATDNWISFDLFKNLLTPLNLQKVESMSTGHHSEFILESACIHLDVDTSDVQHQTMFHQRPSGLTIIIPLTTHSLTTHTLVCTQSNEQQFSFNLNSGQAIVIPGGTTYRIFSNNTDRTPAILLYLWVTGNETSKENLTAHSFYHFPNFFVLPCGNEFRRWDNFDQLRSVCKINPEPLKWASQLIDFTQLETISQTKWSQTFCLTDASKNSVYLKVLPLAHQNEIAHTALITTFLPEFIPTVLAYNTDKRYLLTKNHGGTDLQVNSLKHNVKLLLAFARIEGRASQTPNLLAQLPNYEIQQSIVDLINCLESEQTKPCNFIKPFPLKTIAKQFLSEPLRIYYLEKIKALSTDLINFIGTAQTLPKTLIHTDCQADNAAELPNGHIVFYDWGDAFKGPAGLSISNPLLLNQFTLAIEAIRLIQKFNHTEFEHHADLGRTLRQTEKSWQQTVDAISEQTLYVWLLTAYIDELNKNGYADRETLLSGLPGSFLVGQVCWLLNWCAIEGYAQSDYEWIKNWWIPVLDQIIKLGENLKHNDQTTHQNNAHYTSEDLSTYIQRHTHLTAEYSFKPNSIEIRQYENGYRGLFASKAIARHETILITDKVEGCYSEKQAFEDAFEILKPLGKKKYHVTNYRFILTCGLYTRYQEKKNQRDILFADQDIVKTYSTSVVRLWGTRRHYALIQEIHPSCLNTADATQQLINQIGLDQIVYESLYALCVSRIWNAFGFIPVFDLINSAVSSRCNIGFSSENEKFSFNTTQAIQQGEELLWEYLEDNAEGYWFSYGFLDPERTQTTTAAIKIKADALEALEKLIDENSDYYKLLSDAVYSSYQGDFRIKLSWPAPGLIHSKVFHQEVQFCVTQLILIRNFFRMLVMLEDPKITTLLTYEELTQPMTPLGYKFDLKVINTMLTALNQGHKNLLQAKQQHELNPTDRIIQIQPFITMEAHAHHQLKALLLTISLIKLTVTNKEQRSQHMSLEEEKQLLTDLMNQQLLPKQSTATSPSFNRGT